jgi:membrane protease YdiL (CAAX protease family)
VNFDENNRLPPHGAASAGPLDPTGSPAAPAAGSDPGLQPPEPLLPEDLRAPWGWTDLLLLGLIAVFGTGVAALFLTGIFAAFGIKPGQIQGSESERNLFIILDQALLSLGLLTYLMAQMRQRFEKPFWSTLGWRELNTGKTPRVLAYLGLILGGFTLSILIQLASAGVGTKTKMPIEALFHDRRSAFLLMLMGVLLAPLVEETIFRGYIYPVLARTFGVSTGVLATGVLFGLLHAPQLGGAWGQTALLMVVGIVFTFARAATRTVVASYLLHVSYNSFLFLAFIFASHGLRHLPPGR